MLEGKVTTLICVDERPERGKALYMAMGAGEVRRGDVAVDADVGGFKDGAEVRDGVIFVVN